jgi:hypothetical protein
MDEGEDDDDNDDAAFDEGEDYGRMKFAYETRSTALQIETVVVPAEKGYRIVLALWWEDLATSSPMRIVCERQYLPSKIPAESRPSLAAGQDPNEWTSALGSRVSMSQLSDIESFLLASCEVAQHVNLLSSSSLKVN